MFRGFALSRTHNNDSAADWFISDKRSSDFPMNPHCQSWHAVSRSTWVYYCVVKCPCSSRLTSDNPHTSTPSLIISSPTSCTFPSRRILRIFHVPSLRVLLRQYSCFLHNGRSSNRFFDPAWLLDRERGPCLAGRGPSRNVFLCACIVHSAVREDKMVGSQVFPSRSRETLFQLH